MKTTNEIESGKPAASFAYATAALLAATMVCVPSGLAQDQRTGVAHPDASVITASPDEDTSTAPVAQHAKPSAAIPASSTEAYGPYVPYRAPGSPAPSIAAAPAASPTYDPDASIVTDDSIAKSERRPLVDSTKRDVDAGIVTYVPTAPGEIPEGALIKARLREPLSTLTTQAGTKFTAEVSEPVMREGQVVVPVGTVLEGRVTSVRGGKRIGGSAAIHLEPRTLTLPDGTQYFMRARVIDTDNWGSTTVDNEGTIVRGENNKRNAAVLGLTAGSGAAAGAMIGGVPGALIGAGVGAGASTIIWLKQDRQAELPKDLGLIFSLTEPMNVPPARAAVATSNGGKSGGQ